jgi:hypothetical protein
MRYECHDPPNDGGTAETPRTGPTRDERKARRNLDHAEQREPYKVGDHIQISLNNRILEAVVRAVIEQTDGLRLQVDFGNEQTALIHEWQVVKDS